MSIQAPTAQNFKKNTKRFGGKLERKNRLCPDIDSMCVDALVFIYFDFENNKNEF